MASRTDSISREQQAKAEIGLTAVTPRAALGGVLIFLGTIIAVSLVDHMANRGLWRSLGDDAALQDQSAVARAVRPCIQMVLSRNLGAGNAHVWCGQNGWLYYEPDVRHVNGLGFLDPMPDESAAARKGDDELPRNRDPISAILDLDRQLRSRGITLVLIPTPVKPMVDPEMFSSTMHGPLVNASFDRFKSELAARGIPVFDITPELAAAGRGNPQFLATDTHWRPEAMELAARRLAEFVTTHVELPQTLGIDYRDRREMISGRGDLAAMLALRDGGLEQVLIEPVMEPDGQPWHARDDAEILWLGDSFSIIYAEPAMGFGAAAGFAERFSKHLGRPLDVLRRNDDGAFATRRMLAEELARGHDCLAGKKLVLWQFAARELSFGDWRLIELNAPAPPAAAGRYLLPPAGERWIIQGTVIQKGVSPRPGSVAYRDHILAVELGDVRVEGHDFPPGRAIVYLRSMTDGALTPAAALRVGQHIRLKVRDWSEVSRQYEFIRRSDLPEGAARSQPPCWGELHSEPQALAPGQTAR